MKIATWNIYWLGDRTGTKVTRTPQHEELIADLEFDRQKVHSVWGFLLLGRISRSETYFEVVWKDWPQEE